MFIKLISKTVWLHNQTRECWRNGLRCTPLNWTLPITGWGLRVKDGNCACTGLQIWFGLVPHSAALCSTMCFGSQSLKRIQCHCRTQNVQPAKCFSSATQAVWLSANSQNCIPATWLLASINWRVNEHITEMVIMNRRLPEFLKHKVVVSFRGILSVWTSISQIRTFWLVFQFFSFLSFFWPISGTLWKTFD